MQTVSKSMTVSHWLSWFTAEKKKFRSTISRKQSDRWPVQTLPEFQVRAMTKDDMDRIANDFAVAATYMQKAGLTEF